MLPNFLHNAWITRARLTGATQQHYGECHKQQSALGSRPTIH